MITAHLQFFQGLQKVFRPDDGGMRFSSALRAALDADATAQHSAQVTNIFQDFFHALNDEQTGHSKTHLFVVWADRCSAPDSASARSRLRPFREHAVLWIDTAGGTSAAFEQALQQDWRRVAVRSMQQLADMQAADVREVRALSLIHI